MRIFKMFFVGVFFKCFCRGPESSKKELGNRHVFLFHGFYGFYYKKKFFVWPNGFSLKKGALKVQPNKGRAKKMRFVCCFTGKTAKKVSKKVKKVSKNHRDPRAMLL